MERDLAPTSTPSTYLATVAGEEAAHTPVWFMRQAGRSLPEYRDIRVGHRMLDACYNPDLVTEITLQPVRRYQVDAAILYSDIVVPLHAAGIDVDIVPNVGPVVAHPIRTAADVDAIPDLQPEQVEKVAQAVRQLVGELGDTPLIGFAGAPFTLASYMVEGGPSKNHENTKAMMHGDPGLWSALMAKLAQISATFLTAQVTAGVRAIQVFDSWVGCLPAPAYLRHVQPHTSAVVEQVRAKTLGAALPVTHFGVGTGELLPHMEAVGANVVGVDFRVPLDVAATRVSPEAVLQGNLDPALLFAPWEALQVAVDDVLARAESAKAHVFNLGHGVLPTTDPDQLKRVVDYVHEKTAR